MMNKTTEQMRNEQLAITDKYFEEWHETGVEPSWDYHEEHEKIRKEWLLSLQVGDRAHVTFWTDTDPCTVIKRTKTTITVRYDKAELNGNWKPEVDLGGFVGHCTNQSKQYEGWTITEDPDGSTETFHWSEKKGRWQGRGCTLAPEWVKFYDYNF